MPTPKSIAASARPLRVAHLINPSHCPHALLDEVFREAYSRWGGRRTLLVAADEDGINHKYADWLDAFDPDVLYSYVDLTDRAVADIHERYTPTQLAHHHHFVRPGRDGANFRVDLPFGALGSSSTIPAWLERSRWPSIKRVTTLRVTDCYPSTADSEWFGENFGYLSDSFLARTVTYSFPELFSCLVLISEETLSDRRWHKDENSLFVHSDVELLKRISADEGLVTPVQLSEAFAPYTDYGVDLTTSGFSIVIGDSAEDRWLFWNLHHAYRSSSVAQIHALRIPQDRLGDATFMEQVKCVVARLGGSDGITLRSCSLPASELQAIAVDLRKLRPWMVVRASQGTSATVAIPPKPKLSKASLRNPLMSDYMVAKTGEFDGDRIQIPLATPWHLSTFLVPRQLSSGFWMSDLDIQRPDHNSRYMNRQVWALPRRLRLDKAFKFEVLERDGLPFDKTIRVVASGAIAVPRRLSDTSAYLQVPDDLEAICLALRGDYEWYPFERDRPFGRERYYHAELSENGRYLVGVLERFETLQEAFGIFMNRFWREVLRNLGGVPVEKNDKLIRDVIKTVRRRSDSPTGPISFDDERLEILARHALKAARMLRQSMKFEQYDQLRQNWLEAHAGSGDVVMPVNGQSQSEAEAEFIAEHFDPELESLCAHKVLYQGRSWLCSVCGNRNWAQIEGFARQFACGVCGETIPAPVSGGWHFRPDNFVIDALRDHGIDAVLWTLWSLWLRARRSFFFVPSLSLWESNAPGKERDAEADLLVVVDGILYLCEAKSGNSISEQQLKRLSTMASKIRPDVVLISMMERPKWPERVRKTLADMVPTVIRVEISVFDPSKLDEC